MRRPFLSFAFACLSVAVAAVAPSCSKTQAELPNILLVTIDTLRADHCSAYGYPVHTTPVLDRLATTGTLYRTAYSVSSTTAPSHASLLTGSPFRTLGVFKNGHLLTPQAVTVAEVLAGAGYATAGFISSFPLRERFGFAQGFEFFDDEFTMSEASLGRRNTEEPHDRLAEATFERVKAWLDQRSDKRPLFAWVHFVDPHFPYKAPEKFQSRWPAGVDPIIKRYDAEVRYADKQLGRLVEQFDKHAGGRGNLIIVTSDHGEGLGDHDWLEHGINLYEEAVRVPLVVRWTGRVASGKVVEEPVSLIDVASAIAEAARVEAPPSFEGRSLFSSPDPTRAIFMQRRGYKTDEVRKIKVDGEMTALVKGGTKYITAPGEKRREFYRLPTDPHEAHNLLAPDADAAASAAPDAKAAADAEPAAAAPAPSAPSAAASAASAAAGAPPSPAVIAEADRQDGILAAWRDAHPETDSMNAPVDRDAAEALRSLGYVE